MAELCPMCKKHEAIIITENIETEYKGKMVKYDFVSYFCSTLGEGDEDAYFIPPYVWNENRQRLKEAYEKIEGEQNDDR